MTILMLVLLVAVILAIVFGIRHLSASNDPRHRGGSAQDVVRAEDQLADRFAKGEVDEDEFRRRMTLLREHR
ncbi:SHOCT domain-containing protein [Mycolicibacterium chlorophenolicum]|nr:SHOCT domain-containing protein [Mycolicibacterium chlorophenolicum]